MSFNFPVLIDWFYLHHFIFLTLCLQSPFSLLLPSCSSHISSKYFLNISCFKSKSPFLLLCLQNPHPLLPKYLLVYFILSTITSVSLYHHISQKSGTLTSSSPSCSPRLVSQEGPIPSNWKHSPEGTETLRVSQDSLCSTFVYHLILAHSLSVFQFSFLWHPWHCIVFSSYFFGHFSSLFWCFLFIVMVLSYINAEVPLVSSSAMGYFFPVFSTLGISNSPMIPTILPELVSLKSVHQT